MGLEIAETGEDRAERENLIETKYVGDYVPFKGKTGEAYFDFNLDKWHFRLIGGMWNEVEPSEIDCANDSGWVRGNYLGRKAIGKEGKSFWSEAEEAWVYKPKGQQRTFVIPEGDFKMVRDEDYA